MGHDRAVPLQPPEARKRFAKNFGLVAKLQFVGDMLIVAAAADAEVGAQRYGAIGRRRLDLCHPAANEFLARLHGLDGDALIRQNEGSKHGMALVMREALASIDQLFDSHVDRMWHENSFQLR